MFTQVLKHTVQPVKHWHTPVSHTDIHQCHTHWHTPLNTLYTLLKTPTHSFVLNLFTQVLAHAVHTIKHTDMHAHKSTTDKDCIVKQCLQGHISHYVGHTVQHLQSCWERPCAAPAASGWLPFVAGSTSPQSWGTWRIACTHTTHMNACTPPHRSTYCINQIQYLHTMNDLPSAFFSLSHSPQKMVN